MERIAQAMGYSVGTLNGIIYANDVESNDILPGVGLAELPDPAVQLQRIVQRTPEQYRAELEETIREQHWSPASATGCVDRTRLCHRWWSYDAGPPPNLCGCIDATGDGGHTWRRMLRFTSRPFIGPNALPTAWMHLFDARHALVLPLAVQPRAMLYRTADSGATWAALPLPKRVNAVTLSDVAFVSQRDLWLLDHLGAAAGSEAVRVYRTQDAGRHWTLVACTAFPNPLPGSGCPLRTERLRAENEELRTWKQRHERCCVCGQALSGTGHVHAACRPGAG